MLNAALVIAVASCLVYWARRRDRAGLGSLVLFATLLLCNVARGYISDLGNTRPLWTANTSLLIVSQCIVPAAAMCVLCRTAPWPPAVACAVLVGFNAIQPLPSLYVVEVATVAASLGVLAASFRFAPKWGAPHWSIIGCISLSGAGVVMLAGRWLDVRMWTIQGYAYAALCLIASGLHLTGALWPRESSRG